jgi:transcriptional regulator with XRE-family HTH domain
MKTEERQRARKLRAQGWSVREIERQLGVSRSSVSVWVRDIHLEDAQRRRLARKTNVGQLAAAARKASTARTIRAQYQEDGRRLARVRGPSYAAGCMLYWAEGSKGRNSAQMSNSDPALLSFFAQFLREHFKVPDEAFRIHCNLFTDHLERQREVERFWLSALGLPATSLRKSIVNTYSKYSLKKRANKLPYGTCRLAVHSTRIVQTMYGSIQEYGGFERPVWLD